MVPGQARISETLSVREAAARLDMTPQGVRKAIRERRLTGRTVVRPDGKREYTVSVDAVERFAGHRRSAASDRVEYLSLQLELSEAAIAERDLELVRARIELAHAHEEVLRLKGAVRSLIGDGVDVLGAERARE